MVKPPDPITKLQTERAKEREREREKIAAAKKAAAGIRDGGKAPLFRSAIGRTGALTEKAMHRVDAWRMVQRRAADLGMRPNGRRNHTR